MNIAPGRIKTDERQRPKGCMILGVRGLGVPCILGVLVVWGG